MGLPRVYPMVAANYSATRSELAKSLGLGRKAGDGGTEGAAEKPARKARAVKVMAKSVSKASGPSAEARIARARWKPSSGAASRRASSGAQALGGGHGDCQE